MNALHMVGDKGKPVRTGWSGFYILSVVAAILFGACGHAKALEPARTNIGLSARICAVDTKTCGVRALPSTFDEHRVSIDLADVVQSQDMPLHLLVRVFRFESMTFHLHYADGSARQVIVSQNIAAENWVAGARFSVPLPVSKIPLTRIDTDIKGAYEAKLFAETRLVNSAERSAVNLRYIMLFGMFLGVIVAPICYNLALFPVLRNQFLITYVIMGSATIVYGLFWSNLIYVLFADFPFMLRYYGTHTLIALICFLNAIFLLQFVEHTKLSRRVRVATFGTALLPIMTAIWTVVALDNLPRWFYAAQHVSFAIAAGAIAIACVLAIRRGSSFIYYFLIGWAAGYAAGLLRLMRSFDMIEQAFYVDAALFAAITFQALIIALGIAHRAAILRRQRDRAMRREAEMATLADTDSLTELLNRRAFSDRIAKVADAEGIRALVLFDIDNFKQINDRFGHATGDNALRSIAEAAKAAMPEGGICARLGGEEFGIYLCGKRADKDAEQTARKLHRRIRSLTMTNGSGKEFSVSISVGVAAGPPDPLGGWQALYVAADAALYEAKHRGKDRVAVAWESETLSIVAPASSIA